MTRALTPMAIVLCSLLEAALSFPARAVAGPQITGSSELRSVAGTILFEALPAASAIVYLYDDRTQSVRTYIADKQGRYHFVGLSEFDDYEIHAERGSLISKTRTIRSDDERRQFVINLKISKRG
jgi:hypothetical protein